MRYKWTACLPIFSTFAIALLTQPGQAAEPTSAHLTPNTFRALHALIRPQPGEDRWMQIPWLTSLAEARQQAAKAGKPILLWEMDGHPLGCT
jgi:hypothetical protein